MPHKHYPWILYDSTDRIVLSDAVVSSQQGQSPSLGFALRELLGHLTSAQNFFQNQLAEFNQHCQSKRLDMSNEALRQQEWTAWVKEQFDPDMCPHLQDVIDRCRRQFAAAYSWKCSPSQDVSGHFANAVHLLDGSCQTLTGMIQQGINDWGAFTKLEVELRAAVGYANLSKEVNPDYYWS